MFRSRKRALLVASLAVLCVTLLKPTSSADPDNPLQERIDRDVGAGAPVVVHVVVALYDSENPDAFPFPEGLGNGDDPDTNVFWGEDFGVQKFLTHEADWKQVARIEQPPEGVLRKVVLSTEVERKGGRARVYLVAEAWRGREIKAAITRFLTLAAAGEEEAFTVETAEGSDEFRAGGASHIIAYVGQDWRKAFRLADEPTPAADAAARGVIALTRNSRARFLEPIRAAGVDTALLTIGLIGPAAYTLDAGAQAAEIREAAAQAYNKYQKCGIQMARGLFRCYSPLPARTKRTPRRAPQRP
ncbi:MAG: hypothetical protein ACYTAN_18505 [Planctomycetota bacterium]|jgi:hypothetical protein